jgi:hypothetical protein
VYKQIIFIMLMAGLAQTASAQAAWGGGIGVGNGLEAHVGRQQQRWLLLGRVRYRWWGPSSGPGSSFFDNLDTRSRQTEVAALGGYGLPLGPTLVYGAAGLSYLNGRQLGEYRYALTQSGLFGSNTYYYSFRSYQAVGLPIEIGMLARTYRDVRFGLVFQANFNPEKTLYCGMLTCWLGKFGRSPDVR